MSLTANPSVTQATMSERSSSHLSQRRVAVGEEKATAPARASEVRRKVAKAAGTGGDYFAFRGPSVSPTSRAARFALPKFLLEQGVEGAGVAFSLQLLHRLADEETEQVGLAGLVLLDLGGSAGVHRVGHNLERGGIGDLGQAPELEDLLRRPPGAEPFAQKLLDGGSRGGD